MDKLQERLMSIAKEIARQFGEILGIEPEFWVADSPALCCFGDTLFFTLEEMRVVLEKLPKYVKRYGSKEAVGEEINAWTEWWLESCPSALEYARARVTHQLRPNINLESWLDGCPREVSSAWQGPDADVMRLRNYKDCLSDLKEEFGEEQEIGHVLRDVILELERKEKEKKDRDSKEWQKVMHSQTGAEFKTQLDNFNYE